MYITLTNTCAVRLWQYRDNDNLMEQMKGDKRHFRHHHYQHHHEKKLWLLSRSLMVGRCNKYVLAKAVVNLQTCSWIVIPVVPESSMEFLQRNSVARFTVGGSLATGRNIFNRMGFDDEGIVALSGAHTLGRAFQEKLRKLFGDIFLFYVFFSFFLFVCLFVILLLFRIS